MVVKNKEEEVAIKKLLRDGRRDRALSLLKLKKLRERQVSNCQASYFKLEELVRLPVQIRTLFCPFNTASEENCPDGLRILVFGFLGHEHRIFTDEPRCSEGTSNWQ